MGCLEALVVGLLTISFAEFSYGGTVQIGEFTKRAENVPGLVSFTSVNSLTISGFSFSGVPPDTFLYSYAPGVEVNSTGGGTIIPVTGAFATSEGGFRESVPLNNVVLRVDLPAGMNVCDIGTLTVWCRQVGVIFSVLPIPDATFVNRSPCMLGANTRSLIGPLVTGADILGFVHATSAETVVIENFSFRGTGDFFFYAFPRGTSSVTTVTGGVRLPATSPSASSEGGFGSTAVTMENVTLALNGTNLCNIGSIAFGSSSGDVLAAQVSVRNSTARTVVGNMCLLGVEVENRVVVGSLSPKDRTVGGVVQFLSESAIFVRGLRYDGSISDTFLYYFTREEAVNETVGGTVLRLPANVPSNGQGGFVSSQSFTGNVYVRLPNGMTVCDIGAVTFLSKTSGSERIVSSLPIAPSLIDQSKASCFLNSGTVIAGYLNGLHSVSGFVRITGTSSFVLESFNYDGQPPDTFIYGYSPGAVVNPTGGGFLLPFTGPLSNDEGGFRQGVAVSMTDVAVQMPQSQDVCDIGNIAIWCRQVGVIFDHMEISRQLFEMDGQDPCTVSVEPRAAASSMVALDNCVPFGDSLQVSWTLNEASSRATFRLCGCRSLDPRTFQYLGFGLSGSTSSTSMDGADVAIAWVDNDGRPNAVDYHLQAGKRFQCRSGEGVCPDVSDARGGCRNDITDVSGTLLGNQQCITYTRELNTTDSTCDLPIDPTNMEQYVVWAIGAVGVSAFKHFERASGSDGPVNLARSSQNQCTQNLMCTSCDPFQQVTRSSSTFTAEIGPSGNERGYQAITGQAGWGIAWYINGALIPELQVERGRTYTFVIHGGNNPSDLGNYHPFYITSSSRGGRLRNSAEERQAEVVYAGFSADGSPTGVGSLCERSETSLASQVRQSCGNLTSYINALTNPTCTNPGTFTWTPDSNTPDQVYYQCATHLNLGYKITVRNPPRAGALPTTLPGLATLVSVLFCILYIFVIM